MNTYDVIFVNRLALEGEQEVDRLLDSLGQDHIHTPLILDLDDNLVDLPEHHVDYKVLSPRIGGLRKLIQAADAIIVSTPELAKTLDRPQGRVHVLPNRILTQRVKSRPVESFVGASKVLYFGTSSHRDDLEILRPLFDADSPLNTGLDLVVVGVATSDAHWYQALDLSHICVDTFLDRLGNLNGFRCGLAPIHLNDPINLTKSEIKVVDYSYVGLPVIATCCPQYQRVIEHGVTGFLVSNAPGDWHQCIEDIKSDRRCAELSEQAAERILSLAMTKAETAHSLAAIIQNASEHCRTR